MRVSFFINIFSLIFYLSLRALFGLSTVENVVAGSDSQEAAYRNIQFFFPGMTILSNMWYSMSISDEKGICKVLHSFSGIFQPFSGILFSFSANINKQTNHI
jgi:hypothetical protein